MPEMSRSYETITACLNHQLSPSQALSQTHHYYLVHMQPKSSLPDLEDEHGKLP